MRLLKRPFQAASAGFPAKQRHASRIGINWRLTMYRFARARAANSRAVFFASPR